MEFRHGQWVLFKYDRRPLEGAHVAPNGMYLGIYQKKSKDSYGNWKPAGVFPVGSDGDNVASLVGGTIATLQFATSEISEAQPCLEADWLPQSRRKHIPEGAKLPA